MCFTKDLYSTNLDDYFCPFNTSFLCWDWLSMTYRHDAILHLTQVYWSIHQVNYFSKINLFLFYNLYTLKIRCPNFLLYNLNVNQTCKIPLIMMILALFFIIFAVCSVMVSKVNHWILYFIVVNLYLSLSWRLNLFFQKVYTGWHQYFVRTPQHQDLVSILETIMDGWFNWLGIQRMHWRC